LESSPGKSPGEVASPLEYGKDSTGQGLHGLGKAEIHFYFLLSVFSFIFQFLISQFLFLP
jgi:hypothetical protein